MTSSVQFKGIDAVLEAFQNRDVPSWSLWQGKQFMFKCEGESMNDSLIQLDTILQTLAKSSNAIYTLKVYEDLGKGVKIKSNTPDDGSFNFKLNFDSQEITGSQYSALRNQSGIEQRLGKIEELLIRQAEEEEEEEEEEPRSSLGIIGEIVNDPGLAPIVVPLISKLLGIGNISMPQQMQPVARIAGIDEDELTEAIRILKEHDPNISAHLMKLAQIAQNDKDTFNFLLKTLDGI
jgi:hypothetical protein